MKVRKLIWYITAGIGLVLVFLTGIQYETRQKLQREIADKVLRFHVIANSDEEADQRLKLIVRDAVGAKMGETLSGVSSREECEAVIKAHLSEIEKTAVQTIAEAGYDYNAEAFLSEVDFPVKTYGSYTFPAGRYEALELVIGEGNGHNWWCVMYPNMCFAGSVYEVVEEDAKESLKEVLSPKEYEAVLSGGDYKVRFKYLTFLNELCDGNEE